MIIPLIALFFLPLIALRETKSTSNSPHVLSRILESLAKLSNILGFIKSFQCDGCQQQKRKSTIKLNVFYIRCNS